MTTDNRIAEIRDRWPDVRHPNQAHHDVRFLLAEVERLRERVAQYEGAITWDTTCLNCSSLLDRCYATDAERDASRTAHAALVADLGTEIEWWQGIAADDGVTPVERAHALLIATRLAAVLDRHAPEETT